MKIYILCTLLIMASAHAMEEQKSIAEQVFEALEGVETEQALRAKQAFYNMMDAFRQLRGDDECDEYREYMLQIAVEKTGEEVVQSKNPLLRANPRNQFVRDLAFAELYPQVLELLCIGAKSGIEKWRSKAGNK